jgi:nucleoside-diphosphate-sugar epimerase
MVLDITKARSELSWQPAVGLSEGLKKLQDFLSQKL